MVAAVACWPAREHTTAANPCSGRIAISSWSQYHTCTPAILNSARRGLLQLCLCSLSPQPPLRCLLSPFCLCALCAFVTESPFDSSAIDSPMVIQSPLGGTRHPSVPMLSPDSLSPLATTHDRYALQKKLEAGFETEKPLHPCLLYCLLAFRTCSMCRSLPRPTTIPQSPGTPLQLRNRSKTVVIDDPKVLLHLCVVCLRVLFV